MIAPPVPPREQLALTAPVVAVQVADTEYLADAELAWAEEPEFVSVAEADNLLVAHSSDESDDVAANESSGLELTYREARHPTRDPLRWRKLFTDHLTPAR
jgi:hypothetical protein